MRTGWIIGGIAGVIGLALISSRDVRPEPRPDAAFLAEAEQWIRDRVSDGLGRGDSVKIGRYELINFERNWYAMCGTLQYQASPNGKPISSRFWAGAFPRKDGTWSFIVNAVERGMKPDIAREQWQRFCKNIATPA